MGKEIQPTCAAVLLFADEPGSLLAAYDTRADIRLMVFEGKTPLHGATPNLKKSAKTIRGPLIDQIDLAVKAVLDELAQGLTLSGSGFKTRHVYPERVVKEAIVNAVIHRDYRLNRDIFVRIFDDRIEVESPGAFPGSITPANISRAGSKARNPLIAQNLREFPVAPNIDAGEGVKMMFAEMSAAKLYPPQYTQNTDAEVETVTVTLLNLERPSVWDEVSDWIDRNGSIANAELCKIGGGRKRSRRRRCWVPGSSRVCLNRCRIVASATWLTSSHRRWASSQICYLAWEKTTATVHKISVISMVCIFCCFPFHGMSAPERGGVKANRVDFLQVRYSSGELNPDYPIDRRSGFSPTCRIKAKI